MGVTRYNLLFKLQVKHTYYTEGLSKDLVFTPTVETLRHSRQYRMLHKSKPGELLVAYEAEEDHTPIQAITTPTKLSFSVQVLSLEFLNYTQLPARNTQGQIYCFDNRSGEDTLSVSTAIRKPNQFQYEFTSDVAHVTLKIFDPFDEVYTNQTLTGQWDQATELFYFSETIDLRESESGRYRFQQIKAAAVVKDETFYVYHDMDLANSFGVVEIYKTDDVGFTYGDDTLYNLDFEPRESVWQYNIMLTRDFEGYDFTIEDLESYDTPTGPYTEPIHFHKISEPDRYLKGKTIVFKTGEVVDDNFDPQTIPFYQKPKKELKLTAAKGDLKTELVNLPNPSAANPNTEIFIYV